MQKRKNNNGIFYVVISLIAVFAIASGVVLAFVGNANRVIENVEVYNEAEQQAVSVNEGMLGANPGPEKTERQYFLAGYQSGGEKYATSTTAATYTLVNAEFNGNTTYIDWNTGIDTTLTTMASTSMDWLGYFAGDEISYWFRSATTTAATTITFAAGTGVDIQFGDATGDDLVIDGLDIAKLTFIRKADSDVLLLMTKYTED